MGFRGVSFDAIMILGYEDKDQQQQHGQQAASADVGTQADSKDSKGKTRVPEIILTLVKSNKFVAALGPGIRELAGINFRGKRLLQDKKIASWESGCEEFAKEQGAELVFPSQGNPVGTPAVVKDRRLLTSPHMVCSRSETLNSCLICCDRRVHLRMMFTHFRSSTAGCARLM